MSTAPKVKLLTQPMGVICSALFEGDMTRLLPKIIYFFVRLFGFLIFLDFFKYLKSLKKNKIALKLQTRRRRVSRDKQTSSKQQNIPMLNARTYVQDNETQGKVPSR